MSSTAAAAPTIPPRVRLDPGEPPTDDLLTFLAWQERAGLLLPHPFEVVYSSQPRMNG